MTAATKRPYAFVSYSTRQVDYVRKLNEYLNAQGFDTWFDKNQINPGDNFIKSLADGVNDCSAVVFVWTVDSIRSEWCRREIMFATQCKKPVIRLFLEECDTDVIPPTMRFLFSVDQYEDVRGEKLPSTRFVERLKQHVPQANPNSGQNLGDQPAQPSSPLPSTAPSADKSPDVLKQKLDFYLNWLSAELKLDLIEKTTIDLSGVSKPHASPRDAFMLADEDLEMLKGLWHSPDKQEIAREDAAPVPNVLDTLASLSRVVLLGEPGGGKTTTLQRLALRQIEQYRSAMPDPSGSPSPGIPGEGFRVRERIPVFVKLAAFSGSIPFADYALKTLGDLVPALDQLPVVWLLDSFNEMPRTNADGRNLVNEVIIFLRKLPGAGTVKFVLSCRVNDYKDDLLELPDLDKIELRELSPIQIKAIIDRKLKADRADALWQDLRGSDDLLTAWSYFDGYEADFWQDSREAPDDVKRGYIKAAPLSPEKRVELLEKIAQNKTVYSWDMREPYNTHQKARQAIHADQRKLILVCRNPFTLNLVCAMVAEGGINALPKNRAGLFAGFAELLLAREARLAKQRGQPWPLDTAKRVKTALERVAEALQRTDNGEQRTIIAKSDALAAINQPDGETLLQKAESANLIQIQGDDIIRFTHQLLQEYFATAELRTAIERHESPHRFFSAEWWEAGPYRETFVILGEVQHDPNAVARWLAPHSPEVALDVILRNGEGLTLADVTPETQAVLIAGANARKSEPDPRGRAAAYRILGRLNADKRPGIGLRADGLPDIVWCEVPSGDFIMGSEAYDDEKPIRTVNLPTFYMAQYQITYAQFQAFIDAPDGFSNQQWWEGLHEDGLNQQNGGPDAQSWLIANHPRENVSWYDAMAFCRWLSAKLGYTITLPTEEQWEKAARGTDGREYPYPGEIDPTRGNTDETGIGQTSAVGIFLDGVSPYGVLDMSGNVWEWTLTEYEGKISNNLSNNERRVVRGGSWDYYDDFARAASRRDGDPGFRFYNLGFRLCCGAVPITNL
jgi:formylglycine-generating enzyme required for sulfatase activity